MILLSNDKDITSVQSTSSGDSAISISSKDHHLMYPSCPAVMTTLVIAADSSSLVVVVMRSARNTWIYQVVMESSDALPSYYHSNRSVVAGGTFTSAVISEATLRFTNHLAFHKDPFPEKQLAILATCMDYLITKDPGSIPAYGMTCNDLPIGQLSICLNVAQLSLAELADISLQLQTSEGLCHLPKSYVPDS